MRGVFDDEEFEPAQHRRDPELTLGNGTLLAIFFGLVLICALSFGLGYAVGRRGPSVTGLQPVAGAQTPLQPDASRSKPSATAQPAAQPNFASPPSSNSVAVPIGNDQSAYSAAPAGQQPVHPVLAPTANAPQPVPPQAVRPALPPQAPLIVQIAAVANPEDAQVLLDALRKRGYAVSTRREPEDNLIHVRIGPFNGRAEADRWRQKLLNDGYNAIVMQ